MLNPMHDKNEEYVPHAAMKVHTLFRLLRVVAPKSLPILNSSKFVEKKGFQLLRR